MELLPYTDIRSIDWEGLVHLVDDGVVVQDSEPDFVDVGVVAGHLVPEDAVGQEKGLDEDAWPSTFADPCLLPHRDHCSAADGVEDG